MATLYVTEFSQLGTLGIYGAQPTQVAAMPPNAQQTVGVVATTNTQSNAFAQGTQLVRLHNDAGSPTTIQFGTNPTASATTMRMAANQTEYFTVPLNAGYKVATFGTT